MFSREIDQIFNRSIHNVEKSFIFLYLLVLIQVTLNVAHRIVIFNATKICGSASIKRARSLLLLVEMRAATKHQLKQGYQRLFIGDYLINRPIVIIIKVDIQLAILVRKDFICRDLWEGTHPLLRNFLFHLIDTVKEEVLSLRFVRHILGLRGLYLCMLPLYLIKPFLQVLNVRILRLIVIFEKLQDS